MKRDLSDWKDTFMDQKNPEALGKIWGSVTDIRTILIPDDEIADIGCCHGHMWKALGKPKNYTGFDFSQVNIDTARGLWPTVRFEVGNLFEMTGSWDVVICSRVLMHLPDFELAVERLKGMARRKLVIVIPLGQDKVMVEDAGKGRHTYFRTFKESRVLATGGKITKHGRYSTVIYDR